MKTTFKIIKVGDITVVLLNDSSRISDVLCDVEKRIIKEKYYGIVIFDLLLANGINNRFFEIPFEQKGFVLNKIKKVHNPDTELLKKTNKYYRENDILLKGATTITRLEKKVIYNNLQLSNH